MRAALYARFSTENQRDASIDDQIRECRALAESEKFTVVMSFEDKGISGGTDERPGYQGLLAAARAKLFDVIVVEDLSRLWRNRGEYGSRTVELEDLGIALVTVHGDDTRRDGWGLVLGIKSAMAEEYRKVISRNTRRGLHGKALAGTATGGHCFGYRTGPDGRWAIYEPEAVVVRDIFTLASGGGSNRRIATQLNDLGIRSASGGRWAHSSIDTLLRNPRYSGRVVFGRRETRHSAANSRKVKLIARSKPVVDREAPELAIVDRATFDAVQKIRGREIVKSVT